jgi:hypothetical protein
MSYALTVRVKGTGIIIACISCEDLDSLAVIRFLDDSRVSIWTLSGRQKIDYVCGEKQRALLKYRKGEVDLTFIRDKWYLSICCDIPEPDDVETLGVLGVDLGIVTLATDSNGTKYSGKAVEEKRRTAQHRRRHRQRKGTRAAKRKLKQIIWTKTDGFTVYMNEINEDDEESQ